MSIILFIVILVALILVHEFGHFIVAKKSGLRVDEFGIGFPPRALRLAKKGETEYTLNWLPFGGFVKIFGEDPDAESLDGNDKDRSFANSSKWTQAAVLVAGVGFNVLFAWLLFAVILMAGMPSAVENNRLFGEVKDPAVTVVGIVPDSPAADAGLASGDIVTSLSVGNETLTPTEPEAIAPFVAEYSGEEITISYTRGGENREASVVSAEGVIADDPARFALGIATGLVGTLQLPPHLAIIEGARMTVQMTAAIAVGITGFLASVLAFSADLSQVAGPVGIVGLVGDVSALGLVPLLSFTAFISINLAIINLLPFPALDGGRLLFVAIEAIKGSRIKPEVANALNFLGFALLILLMLVVTYNDILRIAQ